MMRTNSFSVEYTNHAKGVGIICLLLHHYLFVPFHIPYESGDVQELVVALTKVCVPLFAVLSGFGMTKSYRKQNKHISNYLFACKHIIKLLINYWWIYIPVLLLSLFSSDNSPFDLYGPGIKGALKFVLDFSGMRALLYTPTYNNTWWFIEAALVFYGIFPWLYGLYKKFPVLTMGVLAIPLLFVQFFPVPAFLRSGDREVFYLFSFAIGMVLADKDILAKLVDFCAANRCIYFFGLALYTVLAALAALLFPLIGMLLFALAIIATSIGAKFQQSPVNAMLEFCGRYSMNVFMIHSLYMPKLQSLTFVAKKSINLSLIFLLVIISNFAISYLLELVKRRTMPQFYAR